MFFRLNFEREQSDRTAEKTQKAFDHFHKAKEWKMICMIHEEPAGFFDIVIRCDSDPSYRCLCGVCWKRSHLTPAQRQLIHEKQQELNQQKKESLFEQSQKLVPGTYQYGIIDNWKCLDGFIVADSPGEAERKLRIQAGYEGTITIFY